MTPLVVDAALRGKMLEVTCPIQVVDASGKELGHFIPRIEHSEWEVVGPELSEQELDRREREDTTYTLDEVLAHLEKLGCSASNGPGPHLTN